MKNSNQPPSVKKALQDFILIVINDKRSFEHISSFLSEIADIGNNSNFWLTEFIINSEYFLSINSLIKILVETLKA